MSDRAATWIRAQIHDHAAGEDPAAMRRLAGACVTLSRGRGMVFGMALPAELPEREVLREEALAVLRAWVPRLGAEAFEALAAIVERTGLPIEVAARRAEHEAQRRAAIDAQFAAALAVDVRYTDLERAIAADLDDRDAYLVLADALQSKGVPRGELIALQLRGEEDPKLWKAAQKHLDTHHATLIGPLTEHQKVHDDSGDDAFRWCRGYIHRAKLSCREHCGEATVAAILELLMRHPSGRFLAELVIGMNGAFDSGLEDIVATIAAHGALALRTLHLGDFVYPDESEMSWYEVGDLSALWTAGVPRLAHLIVQGANIELGAIRHPALARLEVRTGALPVATARAIATLQCPRLAHLDVWYGDDVYGGDATLDDVEPLLARGDLPGLRHLGLRNCGFADAICGALAKAPLLRQLAVLDLSMGTLSDDGARAIAAYPDKFAHLQAIDVSQTFVTPDGVAALRTIGPRVIADEMRIIDDHDGDRYVAVGE